RVGVSAAAWRLSVATEAGWEEEVVMASRGVAVGIDLGTTYSAVAVARPEGKPQLVINREGETLTPSVVLFADDQVLVGSTARRAAVTMPADCAQFVKRQMGDPNWRFVDSRGREYRAE